MARLKTPVSDDDHVIGADDASVTLVEYGDFECPYCGAAHAIIQDLLERYDDLKFVFRHFPLSEQHPMALPAAIAAEAAGRQGQFWEMHAMLFENQDELSDDAFYEFAEALDLDLDIFENDLNDPEIAEFVQKQFLDGVKSGVNKTPSFFINGERYDGPVDVDALDESIHKLAAA